MRLYFLVNLFILNFGRNNAFVQWLPMENCTLEVFCELPFCELPKFNGKHYWQCLVQTHQKIMDHPLQLGLLRNILIKILFAIRKYQLYKLNNTAQNIRGLILKNVFMWNSCTESCAGYYWHHCHPILNLNIYSSNC